jgi:hypothetical protein
LIGAPSGVPDPIDLSRLLPGGEDRWRNETEGEDDAKQGFSLGFMRTSQWDLITLRVWATVKERADGSVT